MNDRFLQLHTLTSYGASLLNRDDAGFAKRIPFGGTMRTRVSSQCLKRHWRTAESDEYALNAIEIDGETQAMSVRSRRTFEKHVFEPLVESGISREVAEAVTHGILEELLGESKKAKAAKQKATEEGAEIDAKTKQVTVFGWPEVRYLRQTAEEIARDPGNAKEAKEGVKTKLKDKEFRKNLQRMGAGIDASLFGRMTTGDVLARTDAAVHVAHAFTVHKGDFETDYFSAVDDLQEEEETGSGHINTSELTSGLFYGYVAIDVPLLVSNLQGVPRSDWETADRRLAAEVVRRFVHLAATVSPGAKLGSTAPYAYAHLVLAESGNAQPRTLANAFLSPVRTNGEDVVAGSYGRLATHLQELDEMYGRGWERRLSALHPPEELVAVAGGDKVALDELAKWAAGRVGGS